MIGIYNNIIIKIKKEKKNLVYQKRNLYTGNTNIRIEETIYCFIKLNKEGEIVKKSPEEVIMDIYYDTDNEGYNYFHYSYFKQMLKLLHSRNTLELFTPYTYKVVCCICSEGDITQPLADQTYAKISKTVEKILNEKTYLTALNYIHGRIDKEFSSNISFVFVNDIFYMNKNYNIKWNKLGTLFFINTSLEEIKGILKKS